MRVEFIYYKGKEKINDQKSKLFERKVATGVPVSKY